MWKQEYRAISDAFIEEMHAMGWKKNQNDHVSQPVRRLALRAFFSYVESVTFWIKTTSALMHDENAIQLSHEEYLAARGQLPELSEQGTVELGKWRTRFFPNVLFAFKLANRWLASDHVVDTKSSGWSRFHEMRKRRDEVTHPKSSNSLLISDTEIVTLEKTIEWFLSELRRSIFSGVNDETQSGSRETDT